MKNIKHGLIALGEEYGSGLFQYELIQLQGYHLACYSNTGSVAGISVVSQKNQIIVYSTYPARILAPNLFTGKERVIDALWDVEEFLTGIKHPQNAAKRWNSAG